MKWGITAMRRLMLRAVVLIVLLGGLWLALLQLMNSRTFQLGGDLVARASTQQRVVALTFDDGPSDGRVEEILALLRQADLRATFFVIGDQLLANRTAIEPNSYPAVDRDASLIVAHVLERVQPGSIILLHPWPESATATRQAIPLIAAELKERGYRFATVSELLALRQ